jgi:hypothetical protein
MIDWCFAGLVAVGPVENASRHYASMAIDGDDLVVLTVSGRPLRRSSRGVDHLPGDERTGGRRPKPDRRAAFGMEGHAERLRRLHLRGGWCVGAEMDPADTRWTNYNHRIDGWYTGMDLPGSQQMAVLSRFFLDLPWHLLTPRFSDPARAQFTDREESVLATCGQELLVAYFYRSVPGAGHAAQPRSERLLPRRLVRSAHRRLGVDRRGPPSRQRPVDDPDQAGR